MNRKRGFGKAVCRCRKTFEKKTPWHENCSDRCKHEAWILKRAAEINNKTK